mmetsp:Transcript_34572/g.51815  ORF Transcript_34572/g.51815 Transcript_34572/m.51815 type:complete len:149 (-) Transcript_34572:65-511(-)
MIRTKVSVPKTNVIFRFEKGEELHTSSSSDVFCENRGAFVNMTPQSFGMSDRVGKKLTRRSTSEGSSGGLSALVTLISKSTVGSYSCLSTVSHKFFKADDDEEDVENDSSDEYRDRSILDDGDTSLQSFSSARLICRNAATAALANPT